jgi:hypothetical protein
MSSRPAWWAVALAGCAILQGNPPGQPPLQTNVPSCARLGGRVPAPAISPERDLADVAAESLAALNQANKRAEQRDACERRVRGVYAKGERK